MVKFFISANSVQFISARLLLCGSSSDMGQTSYILPVIINQLDHLPIFSLSMANLFSYGNFVLQITFVENIDILCKYCIKARLMGGKCGSKLYFSFL